MLPPRAFTNKVFYLRWLLFVANMCCVMTAALIVQRKYLPLVILLNYLWPTTTILFSVLLSGVTIKRRLVFLIGIGVVLTALSLEVLQHGTLDRKLFAEPADCAGFFFALTGACCWGLYSALSRRFGHETGGSAAIPFFQLTLALGLPLSFIPGVSGWNHLSIPLAGLMAIWFVMQFGAFQAWDLGMRKGNIVLLSLFADVIPWLSLATSSY